MARLSMIPLILLAAGCASEPAASWPVSEVDGVTLRMTSAKELEGPIYKTRFLLRSVASTPLAYEHWMSQGPEPVPYCRDSQGVIRICAAHVYVMADEPYVHESYLQSGDSVEFDAIPARGEQVGVKYWLEGAEHFLWYPHWTPGPATELNPE